MPAGRRKKKKKARPDLECVLGRFPLPVVVVQLGFDRALIFFCVVAKS